MTDNIVEYRLGWVCQLLIETHNEAMIWSTVYKKLREKQRERDREWLGQLGQLGEGDRERVKNGRASRDSFYEELRHNSEKDILSAYGRSSIKVDQ